jgi:hypothetical protein
MSPEEKRGADAGTPGQTVWQESIAHSAAQAPGSGGGGDNRQRRASVGVGERFKGRYAHSRR